MTNNFRKSLRAICWAVPLMLASTASFAFSGTYTVTYLSGPSHGASATQCLVFTKTGGILSFPDSGTWTATTFSGFGGNYVVDGKDLRFYGTFNSGAGVVAQHVTIANKLVGGFDDFAPASSGATASNDGKVTLKPNCTDVRPSARTGSPTH